MVLACLYGMHSVCKYITLVRHSSLVCLLIFIFNDIALVYIFTGTFMFNNCRALRAGHLSYIHMKTKKD